MSAAAAAATVAAPAPAPARATAAATPPRRRGADRSGAIARALIVGCGCRGLELAAALLDGGWRVRGTTRDGARAGAIAAAGVEPAIADPDRLATLLDHVADVALVCWLLGSADGGAGGREAVHGPRLERFLEEIVDTPVRGFLYEAAGSVEPRLLASGAAVVRAAGQRWRIPVEVVETPPGDPVAWRRAMLAAATRLTGPATG